MSRDAFVESMIARDDHTLYQQKTPEIRLMGIGLIFASIIVIPV